MKLEDENSFICAEENVFTSICILYLLLKQIINIGSELKKGGGNKKAPLALPAPLLGLRHLSANGV